MNGLKRISQMKAWLAQAEDLPASTRSAVEAAITKETKTWAARQKEAYDEALAIRDDRYNGLVRRGHAARSELEQLVIDVKAGRITPKDARAKIRDYMAEHNQLTETYKEIVVRREGRDSEGNPVDAASTEDWLAAYAAKEPEDIQEDLFDRFPAAVNGAPDLATLVHRETGGDRISPFSLQPLPRNALPIAPGRTAEEMQRDATFSQDVIWHR